MTLFSINRKMFLALTILSSWGLVECSNAESVSRAKAQAVFLSNERVIEHSAKLRHVDLNRFDEASSFLETLTGISVPGDHNLAADWYPTRETAKAIKPLRHWYAVNKDRLYWDEATKAVKLRPQ